MRCGGTVCLSADVTLRSRTVLEKWHPGGGFFLFVSFFFFLDTFKKQRHHLTPAPRVIGALARPCGEILLGEVAAARECGYANAVLTG